MEPHPLVAEVAKKAAIAWVTPAGGDAVGVWCLWISDALYVVSGPGEQPAPGLAAATRAEVTLRGDHGGRVVTWPAQVSRLLPEDPAWSEVAPALAAKRLNASGGAAQVVARWADECVISRLAPAGAPVEAGPTLPDGSLAVAVRETPAARPARRPFRLHRVRGSKRRRG
jgi:hypothetical protein